MKLREISADFSFYVEHIYPISWEKIANVNYT